MTDDGSLDYPFTATKNGLWFLTFTGSTYLYVTTDTSEQYSETMSNKNLSATLIVPVVKGKTYSISEYESTLKIKNNKFFSFGN